MPRFVARLPCALSGPEGGSGGFEEDGKPKAGRMLKPGQHILDLTVTVTFQVKRGECGDENRKHASAILLLLLLCCRLPRSVVFFLAEILDFNPFPSPNTDIAFVAQFYSSL